MIIKKCMLIIVLGILFNSCSIRNEKENRNIEKFDKVHLVGNVELHLERNSDYSVAIMGKNTATIAALITEVRNGELYIYNETDCDNCQNPKYTIYLNHSGISALNLRGVIKLNSDDEISQNDLIISGSGILNGKVAVAVNDLNVDLRGISNMNISGYANTSNLKVAGIGMINAADLKTKNGKKSSRGIALINK